jgi:sugar lactone lactonase YvrE
LGFVEAPRWHEGRLYFSDFSARTVNSVDPTGDVRRHAYLAGQPSGLGFLPDGSLLVVSTHDGHVVRLDGSSKTVVADIGAQHRGGLNDMVVDADGGAYVSAFAAPPIGATGGRDPAAPSVPLFRVSPAGDVSVVAEDLGVPNGLAITDDGTTLIVAETLRCRLTAFDIGADGALGGRRVHADLGPRKPDGICLDPSGAVWFGSPFTSEFVLVAEGGDVVRTVATPGRWAVACALEPGESPVLWCATVAVTIEDYREGRGDGAIEALTL